MIRKCLHCLILLSASVLFPHVALSTPISFAGYTADTNSAVIYGNELDWLRWDKTIGMTIEQALQHTSAGGWRVATMLEVKNLMISFGLFTPKSNSTFEEHDAFISMFGVTYMSDSSDPTPHVAPDGTILFHGYKEGKTAASARDSDGYISTAALQWGLYPLEPVQNPIKFIMDTEHVETHQYKSQSLNLSGVALVRSNVSESNPAPLITLAIAVVFFSRKLKTRTPIKPIN